MLYETIVGPHRTWWIIAFALSVVSCSILIQNMYAKWNEDPIIISFATQPSSVWEIPFPAVTVCPETKTDRKLFNYTRVYKLLASSTSYPDSFDDTL